MRTWRNEQQIVEISHKARSLWSSAGLNVALEREGRKKKLLQHGVFEFGHPSRCEARRTGLIFVERTRRGAVLVVQ